MEITRKHAVVPLPHKIFALSSPVGAIRDRILLKLLAIHKYLILFIFLPQERVQLQLTALDVAAPVTLGARVNLLIIYLDLAIFDQVVDLEDLVARLRLQPHIVVSNLI